MSYLQRRLTVSDAIFRGAGLAVLAVIVLLASLIAYFWAMGGSVEYELVPHAGSEVEQLRKINELDDRAKCELWGRPIQTGSGWSARFRFPSETEEDDLKCLRQAARSEFDIRKASWLQTKLHAQKPSWL